MRVSAMGDEGRGSGGGVSGRWGMKVGAVEGTGGAVREKGRRRRTGGSAQWGRRFGAVGDEGRRRWERLPQRTSTTSTTRWLKSTAASGSWSSDLLPPPMQALRTPPIETATQQLEQRICTAANHSSSEPRETAPKFDGQEIFCDSTKTDPISWFGKFDLTLQLHYVKEHKHHAYLYSQSGGACQAWLDNLLSKYGVVAGDLHTKISWDDLKAAWHKRFQVEPSEIKVMDKLMVFEQGTLLSTDWIAEYQRLTSVPDIQMGFKAIRHYFISRSYPTLSNALNHVEDTLTTMAELFDKAAQIIITNKEAKNLRSSAPGPSRDQHWPRVAVVAAATPFDQTSEAVQGQTGKLSTAESDSTTLSTPSEPVSSRVTDLHSEAHAKVDNPPLLYSFEDYAARLVPTQGTQAQGQDVCAASSPSDSGDLSSSSGSSRDLACEFNIEVLDPLTSEDFAWLPLPTTGRLSGPRCAALCAHLHMYLSFYAPPTSPMDDEVAVGDILAYVTKVAREFRTQRYDDNNAPLMYVRIQVGQASCNTLLDSGSSRNFMSQTFMQRAGLGAQVRRKANPTAIKLADGKTQQLLDRVTYRCKAGHFHVQACVQGSSGQHHPAKGEQCIGSMIECSSGQSGGNLFKWGGSRCIKPAFVQKNCFRHCGDCSKLQSVFHEATSAWRCTLLGGRQWRREPPWLEWLQLGPVLGNEWTAPASHCPSCGVRASRRRRTFCRFHKGGAYDDLSTPKRRERMAVVSKECHMAASGIGMDIFTKQGRVSLPFTQSCFSRRKQCRGGHMHRGLVVKHVGVSGGWLCSMMCVQRHLTSITQVMAVQQAIREYSEEEEEGDVEEESPVGGARKEDGEDGSGEEEEEEKHAVTGGFGEEEQEDSHRRACDDEEEEKMEVTSRGAAEVRKEVASRMGKHRKAYTGETAREAEGQDEEEVAIGVLAGQWKQEHDDAKAIGEIRKVREAEESAMASQPSSITSIWTGEEANGERRNVSASVSSSGLGAGIGNEAEEGISPRERRKLRARKRQLKGQDEEGSLGWHGQMEEKWAMRNRDRKVMKDPEVIQQAFSFKQVTALGPRWYMVRVSGNGEKRAKEAILQALAELLPDRDVELVIPEVPTGKLKIDGTVSKQKKRLYPGVILMRATMDKKLYDVIRKVPRVTGFYGDFKGNSVRYLVMPQAVRENVIQALFERMAEQEAKVAAVAEKVAAEQQRKKELPKKVAKLEDGAPIEVVSGPFAGFRGKVVKVQRRLGTVKTLLWMFGRDTPAEVSLEHVRPA
ncbi:hypothetical protein CBR_g25746 [Chara braunii]|uniref:KOW domain-containing protein n=1 Tax=Chara braunii TaxID=69332 RepID=A0A388L680_CHABU|nr:hypothetical protein CBR_g25746 [Chara braunii]|eukprot:GBG77815.1 hypothetical protein CBR_g25746 [Chara braunii]